MIEKMNIKENESPDPSLLSEPNLTNTKPNIEQKLENAPKIKDKINNF